MEAATIDLDAYFRRIGHDAERSATLQVLERLHHLHPQAIPFENLSPLLGEPVALDAASLEAKLVHGGRGGYCYEHNLLFQHVLAQLGFDVRGLAARVLWNAPSGARPTRTHMLLLVHLPQGDYIADVGFGGQTLTRPLALSTGLEQATPLGTFRLVRSGDVYLLEMRTADDWSPLYAFDLQEQQLTDYELVSWYLCNHPRSIFVNGLMVARPAPGCRHALQNNRYSVRDPAGKGRTRMLCDVDELLQVLTDVFGVRLPRHVHLRERLQAVLQPAEDS